MSSDETAYYGKEVFLKLIGPGLLVKKSCNINISSSGPQDSWYYTLANMKYNGKNVVLSANFRDYCPECLSKPVDVMLRCDHVKTKLMVPHKSDATKAVIKLICDKFDESETYAEENENIPSSSIVKIISPMLLNLLFRPKNFYDESNLVPGEKILIGMAVDPNGGGECKYSITIAIHKFMEKKTVVTFFIYFFCSLLLVINLFQMINNYSSCNMLLIFRKKRMFSKNLLRLLNPIQLKECKTYYHHYVYILLKNHIIFQIYIDEKSFLLILLYQDSLILIKLLYKLLLKNHLIPKKEIECFLIFYLF